MFISALLPRSFVSWDYWRSAWVGVVDTIEEAVMTAHVETCKKLRV
jgi:hypothetical protein